MDTQFGSSLLIGGLIFVSSGFMIGTQRLVIRQLNSMRDALEADVEKPKAATAEAIPVIPTAILERPSPAGLIKPKETVARDARQAFAVIRAGTVNNMDYELRADGTIVATLSGQTFEFRSIDELRRYLAALSQDNGDAAAGRRSV
ncbi:hypothetical protein [Bradyrhizobium cenepequi]|uniref:hypothetical protein n=1 Tax=Bradyrhizobium cenepequi TaxID=2821403 RepID=UPI001CE2C22A|nr:hypothetical protein [Bradyrhizobium cenepequi]MCA6109786.1 hypothetical protein [Bradyrhizobium cenepequi]